MAAMANQSSAYDLRSAAGWFRLIALAEADSWIGLLIGMYFKYLGSPQTEIGVKVFDMAFRHINLPASEECTEMEVLLQIVIKQLHEDRSIY